MYHNWATCKQVLDLRCWDLCLVTLSHLKWVRMRFGNGVKKISTLEIRGCIEYRRTVNSVDAYETQHEIIELE